MIGNKKTKNVGISISHFVELLNKVDFDKDGKVTLSEVKLVLIILKKHIKEVLKCPRN